MSYTVSLEIPDLCDPGATPLDAVEAFIAAVTSSPDLWVYRVRNDDTGVSMYVDMAVHGKKEGER